MAREAGLAVFILLGVVLLALMAYGWRTRKRRQAPYGRPAAVPSGLGAPIAELEALYLATTPAGQPLERLAVTPLGFRAESRLALSAEGLAVSLRGSEPWFVPIADVTGSSRGSWTIDRGVEADGLDIVSWRLGGNDVESFFRVRQPGDLDRALSSILPTQSTSTEGTPA